jgi:hypothetical protein
MREIAKANRFLGALDVGNLKPKNIDGMLGMRL